MIKKIFLSFFKNIAYVALLLLATACMMYGVKTLLDKGTVKQAAPYCEGDEGKLMKVKSIISIIDYGAQLQMEDDSIIKYNIKEYTRAYKGGNLTHVRVKVGDYICIEK